jgi:hypothetical protein
MEPQMLKGRCWLSNEDLRHHVDYFDPCGIIKAFLDGASVGYQYERKITC